MKKFAQRHSSRALGVAGTTVAGPAFRTVDRMATVTRTTSRLDQPGERRHGGDSAKDDSAKDLAVKVTESA
jgi:hypothetical protein